MKLLFILCMSFLFWAQVVFAYEQNELDDCISSSTKNPVMIDVPSESIENYCDCALTLIVDKGLDIQSSGYKCAVSSFG